MLNIKSKRLLKFVTLMGIGVSLLGAGSVTANASSQPDWNNFNVYTSGKGAHDGWAISSDYVIKYRIDSKSSHYRGIWKKAIANWNSAHSVKLVPAKKGKSAQMHMTSVSSFTNTTKYDEELSLNKDDYANKDGYSVVDSRFWYDILDYSNWTRIISRSRSLLNREVMNNGNYSDKQRINVATRELGYSMGLKYNHKSNSVMNADNYKVGITKSDKKQLKKLYRGATVN